MTELTATDVPVAEHSDDSSRGGHFIEVNGARLYYEDRGAGTPLILIHGGLSSSAMWGQLLPSLIDGFRVITPDSRGHGRSTNPSGALSYTQLADDVAALIAALGLVLPVVGGYSDGGQVVLELGARHPDAAGALIVGAAYPDFAASGLREVWKAFLGADGAGTPDLAQVDVTLGDLADHVKSQHPGGEQRWKTLVQQSAPMWLDYQGLTPDDVRRIEAPALVVTGDRDDMIPLDRMVSLPHAGECRTRGLPARRSLRACGARAYRRHVRRNDPRIRGSARKRAVGTRHSAPSPRETNGRSAGAEFALSGRPAGARDLA